MVLLAQKEPPIAPHNALRTQQISEWMIHLCLKGDNVWALPDTDCFDSVLQAWGRSKLDGRHGASAQKTGNPQMKLRMLGFKAVLAMWGNAANRDASAADNVFDILSFMESWDNDAIVLDCA